MNLLKSWHCHFKLVMRVCNDTKDEIKQKDEFKGELFISHGKTNSCGIAIGYTGKKSFKLLKEKNDENGRFLILKAKTDDCVFILINLCNAYTKKEQVSTR